MSFRSERFNKSIHSLEVTSAGRDPSKWSALSDRGRGVRRMVAAIDFDEAKEEVRERAIRTERDARLFTAELRLVESGLRHLIPTLLLIVDNGRDRDASIGKLAATSKTYNAARKKYFEHRDRLVAFFA